mmetsp:Transcript_7890/g.22372  ORF Transcript_7890/g.22372 Transcript_7890/m.22372 type:complete len:92 (-) Transcript_7890:1084-1359(-)
MLRSKEAWESEAVWPDDERAGDGSLPRWTYEGGGCEGIWSDERVRQHLLESKAEGLFGRFKGGEEGYESISAEVLNRLWEEYRAYWRRFPG